MKTLSKVCNKVTQLRLALLRFWTSYSFFIYIEILFYCFLDNAPLTFLCRLSYWGKASFAFLTGLVLLRASTSKLIP